MNALLVFLAALGFGFVGSIPLTGPIAVLVLSRAVSGDRHAARMIGLGAAVAEGVYAAAAYFAFSAVSASKVLEPIANLITMAVLIGLGIYFARWKFKEKKCRKTKSQKGLWIGFSISIVNPTLLVTWSAVVAALFAHGISPGHRWRASIFGAGAAVGVALWELLFVWLVKRYGDKFTHKTLQWVVRGVGVVLIGVGIWSGIGFWHSAPKPWKARIEHPTRGT